MMATTHALAGTLVGLALASIAPGEPTLVVAAGAVGGVAPDIDAAATHRKTLHFPVVGSVLALGLVPVAALSGSAWVVAATAFVAAGALHALTDALDGGRSLRPWAESVDRAVYCHAQGRWWRPRGWVAYDGSPADLGLAAAFAVAAFVVTDAVDVRVLVVALLLVSVPYVLLRKRLPEYTAAVV